MKIAALSRKTLPFIGALALLVVAVIIFKLLAASRPVPADQPVAERIWTVSSTLAQRQDLAPDIRLYGRLESHSESSLSAAVTAYIAAVAVREGQRVSEGQTLIILDDSDAQLVVAQREAEVADIKAQLAAAEQQHQTDQDAYKIEQQLLQLNERSVSRFNTLKGRNVTSDSQLEEAQRGYQQQQLNLTSRKQAIDNHPLLLRQLEAQQQKTEALLQSARLDVQRTHIIAPFNGRITQVPVSRGERVRIGDPLISLFNSDALQVRAQIPSQYLPQVQQALSRDQPLPASTQLSGEPISLQLERLAADVGSGRAGVDALFSLQDSHPQLAIGQLLELSLTLPVLNNVISLPAQALYGTDRVYRIVDNRLQAVAVTRQGSHSKGGEQRILVSSTKLAPGDRILTTQLPNAMSGLKVKQAEH